jgi:hypothetical protein
MDAEDVAHSFVLREHAGELLDARHLSAAFSFDS